MKRAFISWIVLLFWITACAPVAPAQPQPIMIEEPTRRPSTQPTATHLPVDLTPAQSAAVSALSETLSLPADQITLISTEAVTWPNGCLGVVRMGVLCTQNIVEGFKIILETNGKQYEFHTNQDGSVVLEASLDEVESAAVKQLANNLGIQEQDITVVSSSEIEFPDACMGISMPEVMCAQVITPGRIITLEADGIQYEYHTNTDGSHIEPSTLALTWKREGGIAGFCDNLTVFLSGEVYGSHCKASDARMSTFASLLSVSERKQFNLWVLQYGQLDLDASDPKGVADGMTVLLSLYGKGAVQPSDEDKAAVLLWAQTIYQKLYD